MSYLTTFLQRFVLIFIFSTTLLYSATCVDIPNLNGTNQSITVTENINITQANITKYYKFTTTVNGSLHMTIDKDANTENVKFSDNKCDGNKIYQANNANNVDEIFTITANTTYYIKIKEKNNANKLKYTMTLKFTKALPYGGQADDICYDTTTTSGLCTGAFSIGCTVTTPLKNISSDTLTNVNAALGTSSAFSLFSDCGVDGVSGSCTDSSGMSIMGFSAFNGGINYIMPDYTANDTHSSYNTALFSFLNSPYDWVATYEKNGYLYQGAIKACAGSTPPPIPSDEPIPTDTSIPEAPTCGVFEDALQTHDNCASGSDIYINNSTLILNNNGDTELSTCMVTDATLTWGLSTSSCDTGECTASGTPAESINLNYDNSPVFDVLNVMPTTATTDLTLPGTFSEYEINQLNAPSSGGDTGTINVTNSVKINTIDLATNNTLAFESTNEYNIEIGTLTSGHNLTLSNTTNAKNIKIENFDGGSDHSTINLTASQTIKMNSFKFGNTSTVVLKAQYIQINNFDFSSASNTNLTIYSDYLDIGDIKPNGSTATITIKPYTPGKRILARFNNFYTGSESEFIFSSGNYYVNDTMFLHGSGTGTKLNLEDSSTSVNFYLNKKPDAGNNFIINATSLNGGFDANANATQFNLFVNGDFETGVGGTTINATIYAENDISITSGTKIKGAVSAGGKVTTDGGNVEITYDQTIANNGWAACSVTIGFDKDDYNTTEDYTIFDNFTSELEITIELSSPMASDTSVTYTTRDGTAFAGTTNDYLHTTGTATILAGESKTTIYIDIVHDIDIELDEYFFVDLSNISPSDGSVGMGINPVKVTILAQTADDLPLCYSDTFSSSLDNEWRTLRGQNYDPQVVDGRLRLTDGSGSIATAVTKDYEFASQHNMIVVEFEQYAYGGCMDSGAVGSGLGTYGADGIVAVLYNSDIGAEPEPGAVGGSMGYAQNDSRDGFQGGWLGLGIDEYGNYANPTEGRDGGIGFSRNYVSIRGDGDGRDGYEFLAASKQLTGIADKWSSTPKYGHKYKMTTDARDPNHLFITLERDSGSGYQIIIDQFDAKDAQYKQSTTPDYVRFAFTSGTGGGCNRHEIDELSVRGYCQPYDPNPPSTVENKSDVVNGFVDDANYNLGTKYIKTKVAGKTENITGVHLDDSSRAVPYSSRDNLTFKIIPYLSDATCSNRTVLTDTNGNPAVINVTNGNTVGSLDVVMPKNATKDSRISLSALDFQQVYTNSNQQCLKTSSSTGNLQGIGECSNEESKYLLTFGEETWQRCYVDNGQPCKSNNGVGDAPYNNSYGCLMCTLDTSSTCSSDNFAIRPDGFSLTSASPDFPDLLRAAEDYALTLKAFNFNNPTNIDDLTTDYNITDAQDIVTFSTTLNAPNGTPDANLAGITTWSAAADFDIIHGFSTDGVNNEVASLKFNNVGKVNIAIEDRVWANVDLTDERGMKDPSATQYNNCNADGAYVCGNIDTTFIPHHFTLLNTSITNNDDNPGSFTYFSTLTPGTPATYAMAARVTTQIESRNKDEGVTTNFRTASYENPLNVRLVVNDGDHGAANPTEIGDGTAAGNRLLNFINGTYTVPWNETDNNKILRFNFTRTNNVPLNPFTVTPNEVNILVDSIYTAAGTPSSPATISVDTSGDGTIAGNIAQDATFIYGRTNAPRQRFEGATGNAFIYYEAYCSGIDVQGVACVKALLPNANASISSDDPRWFINPNHDNASEGTAGAITQKGAAFVNAGAPVNYPTSTTLLTYTPNSGYPYKATMLNSASPWLLYDPFIIRNQNEFQVEFTNTVNNWAGQDTTDNDTGVQGTNRTNRRSMW